MARPGHLGTLDLEWNESLSWKLLLPTFDGIRRDFARHRPASENRRDNDPIVDNPGLAMRTTILRAAGLLAAGWFLLTGPAARAGEDVRFNRDVRPILADTCFRCHGPAVKKAGLRLDQRDVALKPTESGAVPIVPGNAEESEVIRRIFSDDASEVMPPPAGPQGAERRAEGAAEAVGGAGGSVRGALVVRCPRQGGRSGRAATRVAPAAIRSMRFIAARLRKEGLAMSPEADKATLIRRVTFALTGLPPTPQEVAVFLGDTSSRAYENLVERLLFSPRFGEEMARHWLDVARYADTHGLHLDNERQMWLYRDWVVRAFNDNMPFDRFTDRAARRRPAARSDPRAAGGDRLQPLRRDDQRRGLDRGGMVLPQRRGPRQHHGRGLDGTDRRLCGLPRPQVRPALAEGVLLALRLLLLGRGPRAGRQRHAPRAGPEDAHAPSRRRSSPTWTPARRAREGGRPAAPGARLRDPADLVAAAGSGGPAARTKPRRRRTSRPATRTIRSAPGSSRAAGRRPRTAPADIKKRLDAVQGGQADPRRTRKRSGPTTSRRSARRPGERSSRCWRSATP